jgi:hypothetical protein
VLGHRNYRSVRDKEDSPSDAELVTSCERAAHVHNRGVIRVVVERIRTAIVMQGLRAEERAVEGSSAPSALALRVTLPLTFDWILRTQWCQL